MEEFLKFGRLKRECVKIQGDMPPQPLPTPIGKHAVAYYEQFDQNSEINTPS